MNGLGMYAWSGFQISEFMCAAMCLGAVGRSGDEWIGHVRMVWIFRVDVWCDECGSCLQEW